jgi:uncharacterized protein YeaO (DUF488 family)
MTVKIKRIYEPFSRSDGYRVLVDRIWPRGIKKEKAHIDKWMKEVAPSTALRKWFGHDAGKWSGFIRKYKTELKRSEAYDELRSIIKKQKVVTLVYSAKDQKFNQALALKQFITG